MTVTGRALFVHHTDQFTALREDLAKGHLLARLRDLRQYQEPETADIRRGDKRHLAFAAGPHFFRTPFDRFGEITPAAPGRLRTDQLFQYGYANLPVTIAAK